MHPCLDSVANTLDENKRTIRCNQAKNKQTNYQDNSDWITFLTIKNQK